MNEKPEDCRIIKYVMKRPENCQISKYVMKSLRIAKSANT